MTTINYQGRAYSCHEGETILDAMLRQGVNFPFSCRKGICHTCLHRADIGRIPPEAQKGIDIEMRRQGLFLACVCQPIEDMTISTPAKNCTKQKTRRAHHTTASSAPDPDMWKALDEGRLLNIILDDFYTRAYDDERLAPYFRGVTKQRAIEKQYLFLRQQFTGEKVYFGDRPRNAHHWMVINDELFDYREDLMLNCLRRHGMSEDCILRWRAMEERFRSDIVKDKPWKKEIDGMELPLDGYGESMLEVGSLCDSCGGEIEAGVTVRYHLRLGSVYCPSCMDGPT